MLLNWSDQTPRGRETIITYCITDYSKRNSLKILLLSLIIMHSQLPLNKTGMLGLAILNHFARSHFKNGSKHLSFSYSKKVILDFFHLTNSLF